LRWDRVVHENVAFTYSRYGNRFAEIDKDAAHKLDQL
jgi:hypothetical protein